MDPHQDQPRDLRTLRIPKRRFVTAPPQNDGHEAAAHVVRQQINQVYETAPPNQHTQVDTTQPVKENPYQRTHQEQFDWRQYHTAWQQYYQKYYERYYWQQLHAERQKMAATAADQAILRDGAVTIGVDPNAPEPQKNKIAALKTDITNKVKERAQKVRRSNHFLPIMSALGVGLAFIFLQFNSVVFAQIQSYISPGAISSEAISIDPSVPVNVGPEPKLIIPKINVEVPVDYDVTTVNEAEIQQSLRDGATHYKLPGANALPGQKGNTVILGHSSNDIFNQGAYKFVFVLLDRLQAGDVFYLHYNGTRYIYRVTELKVINPTDISALRVGGDKPMATLITCTPPGTALQRLLVYGEQISPDPGAVTATQNEQEAGTPQNNTLAGNEPTLLDQIWQFFF